MPTNRYPFYVTIFVLFQLSICASLTAQRYTISGYVRDVQTGESLIMSSVFDRHSNSGSTTNSFGYYSITLKGDSVNLFYSFVGYGRQNVKFLLKRDTLINIGLAPHMLDEIVITPDRSEIVESIQMSAVNVSTQQIKDLPALMGEVDVLKVLQLLPGVQSGNEGSSGIYVRGGGPDQNLMLLDGVPIYNAAHLFGFFSVFNADAISQVELIKGGFPARYGGRLSSVIDITMKDGNLSKVKGEGSIGLISSKISVEGPLKKDRASFIISARRTYVDLLARPLMKKATKGESVFGYYFYDLNTKFNYIINHKSRLFLSTYTGYDKAYGHDKYEYSFNETIVKSNSEYGLRWGNIITALRWNYVINQKLFSNVTGTYSKYNFDMFGRYNEIETTQGDSKISDYKSEYISGIRDWALKYDLEYLPHPDHYVRMGAHVINHRFTPGVFSYGSNVQSDTTLGAKPVDGEEFSLYAEDDFKINSVLKVNAGIHASGFLVENTFYHFVQPRVSARYLIGETLSLKASYARMAQFLHLLSNAGIGLPTDLWVPATKRISPQLSDQVALGLEKTFSPVFGVGIEGYYKNMRNIIEYKDGASFINVDGDWQDKVVVGDGWSYGSEILLRKNTGKLTGWVGYTLSWTERQFNRQPYIINSGNKFPYKYDRRHDISIALTHQWNKKIDFSLAWVYGTGNAVSLPTNAYEAYGGVYYNFYGPYRFSDWTAVHQYNSRNDFRMRSYHRLDLSISFSKDTKWGQRKWTIGIYNAYNRKNPFFLKIERDPGQTNKSHVMQYSLFPIIPSISYSFKF